MIEGLLIAIAMVGTHLAAGFLVGIAWPSMGHAGLWGVLTAVGLRLAWRSVLLGQGPLIPLLLLVGAATSHTWVCLQVFPGGGSAAAWFWSWVSIFGIGAGLSLLNQVLPDDRISSARALQASTVSLSRLMALMTAIAVLAAIPHHLPISLTTSGWAILFFAPNLGLTWWLQRHWPRHAATRRTTAGLEAVLVVLLAAVILTFWPASSAERITLASGLVFQTLAMGSLLTLASFPTWQGERIPSPASAESFKREATATMTLPIRRHPATPDEL